MTPRNSRYKLPSKKDQPEQESQPWDVAPEEDVELIISMTENGIETTEENSAEENEPEPEKMQFKETEASVVQLCSRCHKPISRDKSMDRGMGDVCAGHTKILGTYWGGATMEEHYEKLKITEVPDGWIKFTDAVHLANMLGFATHKFMVMCGGDRALKPPFSSNFQVKYLGRTRYVSSQCIEDLRQIKAQKLD